jgi:hypothetical protein
MHLRAGERDFFLGLAQGGGDSVGIFGINPATRKGNLARVTAHSFGPLGQNQAGVGTVRYRTSLA